MECGAFATGAFWTSTITEEVPRLFAASRPSTEIVWAPSENAVVSHCRVNGADVSGAPSETPSTLNVTLTTPTLSVASAVIVTMPATAPALGLVIVTVGAWRSAFAGSVWNVTGAATA